MWLKGNSIFQFFLNLWFEWRSCIANGLSQSRLQDDGDERHTNELGKFYCILLHFLVNSNLVMHADKVSAMLAYRVRWFKQLTLSRRHFFFSAQFHFSSRAELRGGGKKTIIWGSSTDLYYMSVKQQQHHQQRCRQRSCRHHTCVPLRGNEDIILIWGKVWPCSLRIPAAFCRCFFNRIDVLGPNLHGGVTSDTQILQMNLVLDHHLRWRHSAEEEHKWKDEKDNHGPRLCVSVEFQPKKKVENGILLEKLSFRRWKKLKALINKMAGVSWIGCWQQPQSVWLT